MFFAFKEGKMVAEMTDSLQKLYDLWTDALEDAGKNYSMLKDTFVAENINIKEHARTAISKQLEEWEKPITLDDINTLRSIGRKSINAFSPEDIKKAQKWAYKFYKDIGVKSPFFRAWFGEWRAHDIKSPAETIDIPQGVNINSKNRYVKNSDTLWKIQITDDLIQDSLHYANKDRLYIERLLTHIDKIIEKAIYLDTAIVDKNKGNKKGSSQFMHYLYAVVEYQGAPFLAKLAVEEYNAGTSERAYNIQRIKMSTLSRAQYSQLKTAYRGKYASSVDAISISDLYSLVKTFDKDFSPAPEVSKYVLNEDGTPKVFYHGTREKFTEFDKSKIGSNTDDGVYGKGFYFSSYRKQSEQYGELMPCYLALKNPLVLSNYQSIAELADALDMSESNFSESGGIIKPRYSFVSQFTSHVKSAGFDGVIVDYGSSNEIVVFEPTVIKSATDNIGTFDKAEGDILYSIDDDSSSVSTRSLLANALETTAQNDIERNKLAQYKEKIDLIESEYEKLSKLKAEIKELSFAKGKRDTARIKELQFEANKTANRINVYDRQLLNLESTTALKNVLQREKELARRKEAQKERKTRTKTFD